MSRPIHLIDAAVVTSDVDIARESRELFRLVRRFNLPVQLALLAAERVASSARDASAAGLVSIAPCRGGSPQLDAWLETASRSGGGGDGELRAVPRMNPVLTLHVVDNLALSGFAIHFGNRSHCLGLGGAPGQAWNALEAATDLLGGGEHEEVIVMAGDSLPDERSSALGVAMLWAARPMPYRGSTQATRVRLVHVARDRRETSDLHTTSASASSSRGLARFLRALDEGDVEPGPFDFVVPPEDGDGQDEVTIHCELQRGDEKVDSTERERGSACAGEAHAH